MWLRLSSKAAWSPQPPESLREPPCMIKVPAGMSPAQTTRVPTIGGPGLCRVEAGLSGVQWSRSQSQPAGGAACQEQPGDHVVAEVHLAVVTEPVRPHLGGRPVATSARSHGHNPPRSGPCRQEQARPPPPGLGAASRMVCAQLLHPRDTPAGHCCAAARRGMSRWAGPPRLVRAPDVRGAARDQDRAQPGRGVLPEGPQAMNTIQSKRQQSI